MRHYSETVSEEAMRVARPKLISFAVSAVTAVLLSLLAVACESAESCYRDCMREAATGEQPPGFAQTICFEACDYHP